ncbi:hypothetical protein K470DRAFT_207759, partial [Piedraia hortae CBS 480.64]
ALAPRRPALSPVTFTPSATPSTMSVTTSIVQTRGAKRDTYNPSHKIRKRRHGFLSRIRTRTGRKILKRRMLKGRSSLSH